MGLPGGEQRAVFVLTWIGYAGFYLCRKNFSVLMPLLKDEPGVTTALLAQAVLVYSAGYALGQVLLGMASDTFGARRVAAVGMVVSAVATALMGLLPVAGTVVVLQGVNGLAQAAGWPALVKMMTSAYGRDQRGVVMAWWCSNYVVGAFAATMFATFAMAGPVLAWLGWQRGAWAPALALGALAVLFWRRAPDTGRKSLAARSGMAGGWAVGRIAELLRQPEILTIAAAYFFIKLTRYALLFWLPLYMVERLAYSVEEAGYTSAVYELAGFAGVLLSGYLSDRVYGGRRFPVGALMLGGLAAACLAFPALSASGRMGNWIGIGLLGVLTFGPDTLMGGAATQDAAGAERAGTAAGLVNGVGSVGQMLSPLVVSCVVETWNWDTLFYLFVACSAAGSLVLSTRWGSRPLLAAAQEA